MGESQPEHGPAAGSLVMMLIEFDGEGGSIGRSWLITDPNVAAHLRHLAGDLGPPDTVATGQQARQELGLPPKGHAPGPSQAGPA